MDTAHHSPKTAYETELFGPLPRFTADLRITGTVYTGVATALRNRLAENTGQLIIVASDVPSLRTAIELLLSANLLGPSGGAGFDPSKVVAVTVASPEKVALANAVCDVL